MNGFVLVVVLIIGAFSSLTLGKSDEVVLVEVYGTNVVLVVVVPVVINTGFA